MNYVEMTIICNPCNADPTSCKAAWIDGTCKLQAEEKRQEATAQHDSKNIQGAMAQ